MSARPAQTLGVIQVMFERGLQQVVVVVDVAIVGFAEKVELTRAHVVRRDDAAVERGQWRTNSLSTSSGVSGLVQLKEGATNTRSRSA